VLRKQADDLRKYYLRLLGLLTNQVFRNQQQKNKGITQRPKRCHAQQTDAAKRGGGLQQDDGEAGIGLKKSFESLPTSDRSLPTRWGAKISVSRGEAQCEALTILIGWFSPCNIGHQAQKKDIDF
jgi:hypothetical protein